MQLIVFLGLLVGSALAATVDHVNVTVFGVAQARDDLRFGSVPESLAVHPVLSDLKGRSFIYVHPDGQKLTAVYVQNGLQGLGRHPQYVQQLTQGDKVLVLAYPWQLPRNVVDHIPGLSLVASAGHEQVGISQLAQIAAEFTTHPILLVQDRKQTPIIHEEQLNEVGTVQVTHDGNLQIVRDVVVERLQDPKYGAFFNPYGFSFQGYNTAYPFNFGNQFPYYGFQAQYPGYGYQGLYPSYPFQVHHPYSGYPGQYSSYGFQAQYPFSGFQGQYPGYGFQAQYPFSVFQGQIPRNAFQGQQSIFEFQSQYPYYGFQGQYPGYTFQAQYPFYGFQGQYPSYGYQGQYNYGPNVKATPTYPGYNCYQGYSGVYPGYGGSYLYPGTLGNPLGYNLIPSPYYPFNPFFVYGQRNQENEHQGQTTKEYSGYQYGSYPPFYSLYAQQPQYQYGYQYQGYPTNSQSYPYSQPGAKTYQYTPYQFQEYQSYQYQPSQFQQYQPYQFPQYQPHQYQYYQPSYGQYYPQ